MEFLRQLTESQFISSKNTYKNYTAQQISEMVYLHIIALRILATEYSTKEWSKKYATKTLRHGNFDRFYPNLTDLYLLIHALVEEDIDLKMPDASEEFKNTLYINLRDIIVWLKDIRQLRINESRTRRLFMSLDGQLMIKNSSMKSIRRLVQDWPKNTQRQKQLSMTRLLQLLRIRSRKSDITIKIEKLAKELDLEIKNAGNPDVGEKAKEYGDAGYKKPSKILKHIGAFAGGILGYNLLSSLGESIEDKNGKQHTPIDGVNIDIDNHEGYIEITYIDATHDNYEDAVNKLLSYADSNNKDVFVDIIQGRLSANSYLKSVGFEYNRGKDLRSKLAMKREFIVKEDGAAAAPAPAASTTSGNIAGFVKPFKTVQKRKKK